MNLVCQYENEYPILFLFGFHKWKLSSEKGFIWGEWVVLVGLIINLRNYFFASLTLGSCFRLPKNAL